MQQVSRILTLATLISLIATSLIPIGIYMTNQWDQSSGTMILGEPLSMTVFSSYTGENGSSLVYPDAYESTTLRPLVLMTDYAKFIEERSVDYDEALSIAEDWVVRIGPPMIEWDLWYHLNSTDPPSWTFFFNHMDFVAFVSVDALEGTVIEYESKYLHDYDPTPLDLQEAENLTLSFMESENIILPSTARYITGEPYDCQRFYSLIFQEYAGPVKVDGSQVLVRTSAFTRGISYYKYSWLGISEIDLTGIVSPEVVQYNALLQLGGITNPAEPIWLQSELTLVELPAEGSTLVRTWRLAWVMELGDESNEDYDAQVFSDAFSGNVFGFRDSETSYSPVPERTTLYSTELPLGVSGISIVLLLVVGIYVKFRRRKTS